MFGYEVSNFQTTISRTNFLNKSINNFPKNLPKALSYSEVSGVSSLLGTLRNRDQFTSARPLPAPGLLPGSRPLPGFQLLPGPGAELLPGPRWQCKGCCPGPAAGARAVAAASRGIGDSSRAAEMQNATGAAPSLADSGKGAVVANAAEARAVAAANLGIGDPSRKFDDTAFGASSRLRLRQQVDSSRSRLSAATEGESVAKTSSASSSTAKEAVRLGIYGAHSLISTDSLIVFCSAKILQWFSIRMAKRERLICFRLLCAKSYEGMLAPKVGCSSSHSGCELSSVSSQAI